MKFFSACALSLVGEKLTAAQGHPRTFVWDGPSESQTVEMANTEREAEFRQAEIDAALLAPSEISQPPNPNFIFHNKLPKSGSTTMKYIVDQLAISNKFTMDYQPPCLHPPCNAMSGTLGDGIGGQEALIRHVAETKQNDEKYFLLKHHYYLNFTNFEAEQPTMINVVRDPVSRFSSMYYFNRYGFSSMGSQARQGVQRHVWKGKEEDIDQNLDQCIQKQSDECMEPIQVMVRYFCGTAEECGMKGGGAGAFGAKNDWNKVARAAEMAKYNILNNYYAIGIMEQFDASLSLFEKLLPDFFKGAVDAYHSKGVQDKRASSSTAVKHGFSNETRAFMEAGPLRYEVDLYNLVMKLFKEKLNKFGISLNE